MSHSTELELLLLKMMQTTESIQQLDMQEEADNSLLLSLQMEQITLRSQIETVRAGTENHMFTDIEKQYLKDCLQMEKENIFKLEGVQEEIRLQLQRMNVAKNNRNRYQNELHQHSGYFIDKHN